MPKYKIKKPRFSRSRDGVPIEEWTTHQVIGYFEERFKATYNTATRSPIGEMLKFINQRSINRLAELEPKETRPHPNQLFKEFIDWVLKSKPMDKFRVWFFGRQDVMVDFLNQRAAKMVGSKIGDAEAFERMERERIRQAKEFFRRGKG